MSLGSRQVVFLQGSRLCIPTNKLFFVLQTDKPHGTEKLHINKKN